MEERLRGSAVVGTVVGGMVGAMAGTVAGAVAALVVGSMADVADAVAGAMVGSMGTVGTVVGSVSPGVTLGIQAESRPTPEPNSVAGSLLPAAPMLTCKASSTKGALQAPTLLPQTSPPPPL